MIIQSRFMKSYRYKNIKEIFFCLGAPFYRLITLAAVGRASVVGVNHAAYNLHRLSLSAALDRCSTVRCCSLYTFYMYFLVL